MLRTNDANNYIKRKDMAKAIKKASKIEKP